MNNEMFEYRAIQLVGPVRGWQTAISKKLNVSDRTVRRWIVANNYPDWVDVALNELKDSKRPEFFDVVLGDLKKSFAVVGANFEFTDENIIISIDCHKLLDSDIPDNLLPSIDRLAVVQEEFGQAIWTSLFYLQSDLKYHRATKNIKYTFNFKTFEDLMETDKKDEFLEKITKFNLARIATKLSYFK